MRDWRSLVVIEKEGHLDISLLEPYCQFYKTLDNHKDPVLAHLLKSCGYEGRGGARGGRDYLFSPEMKVPRRRGRDASAGVGRPASALIEHLRGGRSRLQERTTQTDSFRAPDSLLSCRSRTRSPCRRQRSVVTLDRIGLEMKKDYKRIYPRNLDEDLNRQTDGRAENKVITVFRGSFRHAATKCWNNVPPPIRNSRRNVNRERSQTFSLLFLFYNRRLLTGRDKHGNSSGSSERRWAASSRRRHGPESRRRRATDGGFDGRRKLAECEPLGTGRTAKFRTRTVKRLNSTHFNSCNVYTSSTAINVLRHESDKIE
ncbi:hypothetical protein EVAR_80421_1 [Eumeta japonica]|uniref:Uncharacterized protein n=1 Tax=Eumeta variegata TaxID=151549 RepID=A0A4C1VIM5_EUMVA|nr:hypothetical protein EVAR_80421_1 [Eumeta japonica]